jgi:hypothetical protein
MEPNGITALIVGQRENGTSRITRQNTNVELAKIVLSKPESSSKQSTQQLMIQPTMDSRIFSRAKTDNYAFT